MSLGPCLRKGRLPALFLVTWPRPPVGESSLVPNCIKGIAELSLPLQKKAPPPPPTSFPRVPQVTPTGPTGPPTASVNVFSRKAGNSYSRNQRCLYRTLSCPMVSRAQSAVMVHCLCSGECVPTHAVCARLSTLERKARLPSP